jgi:hypothetical protein
MVTIEGVKGSEKITYETTRIGGKKNHESRASEASNESEKSNAKST